MEWDKVTFEELLAAMRFPDDIPVALFANGVEIEIVNDARL